MWNPSIHVMNPRLEQTQKFDNLTEHYNVFYTEYMNRWQFLSNMVRSIHVDNGMADVLTRGRTSTVEGTLILVIRLKPQYNLKYGDKDFDMREKIAHENEYGTEFAVTLRDNGEHCTSTIGLKSMTRYGIMVAEIPAFDSTKFAEQVIPKWFIENVQTMLHTY